MTDVVSVKFKGRGKTYFFDPNGVDCKDGQQVVVETSKGLELAECVQGPHTVMDERIVPPLRPVIRVATADDLRIAELCKQREKEAFGICEQKIAAHGLDMKLVDVECNFEGNKILFFFTSDGRVDFRELVKDLASIFRARIELRQIGVRDEAKMLGGLGICGRPFCCHAFLDDFEPVSTKMAKTQSLSLNPTKISGSCGRLMCCLRYEQEAYEELVKTVPKNGAFVQTPCGYGNVCQVNLLRQKVKVKLDGVDEAPKGFDADEVAAIPGGRPKPGEPLPDILVLKPKEEKEEEPSIQWKLPAILAEDTVSEEPSAEAENGEQSGQKKRSRNRNRSRSKKSQQAQQASDAEQKKSAEPKAEKNSKDGQTGEKQAPKSEGGQQKKKSSRSRKRGANKPQSGEPQQETKKSQQPKAQEAKKPQQPKAQQEAKKPQQPKAQQETKKPQQPKAQQETKKPQQPQGEKSEGAPKKKNNYRRYRGKPKNKASGGAPKAE